MLRKALMLVLAALAAAVGPLLVGNPWSVSGASAATPLLHLPAIQPSGLAFGHGAHAGQRVGVTMPPAGLSIEYPVMARDLGTGACPPPALVAELLRLGSPPLSLAGDSQDWTAPSGALTPAPSSWEAATLYPLAADFWNQLHCLTEAVRDPLTAGINAKTGQASWAAQVVSGAQSAATNGLDFSLGNEPDLYDLPNLSALGQRLTREDVAAVNRYLEVATYLQQAIGYVPLLGPELAAAGHWQRQLPRVIAALHEQTVGVHMYPLSACATPRAVTLQGLLSASAADAPRHLAWVVADASAAQVPAIISEANSASCGGKAGVSDSPAAAVWAVRFVLSALKTGFREVRFHFSGGPYDPFIVRGGKVIARPLESALVALNQWLPVGSSLQTVASAHGLLTTSVSGRPGGPQAIFDNEGARAQTVVLPATQQVVAEVLSAARAGLATRTLRPAHGRVKLTVAGNSVLALLAQP